ncbi:hypothetical protein BT69DRAFT_1194258, partial [Atractiella rhizophila]
IIGKMVEAWYDGFSDHELSLAEQGIKLSVFAHLCLALVNKFGEDFMHHELHQDLLLDVASLLKLMARACMMDEEDYELFLVWLGMDELEKVFAIVRTLAASDPECDVIQLKARRQMAYVIQDIWSHEPDLKPVHSRLDYKTRDGADHMWWHQWKGN